MVFKIKWNDKRVQCLSLEFLLVGISTQATQSESR